MAQATAPILDSTSMDMPSGLSHVGYWGVKRTLRISTLRR